MSKKVIFLVIFSAGFSFASTSLKVSFVLGKPFWSDGKNRVAIQPNQVLTEKASLFLPKGSIVTLEFNGQKIRIKGENQFKIKDLIDNIGQFEKFLDAASKRKAMTDKMLLKIQPTAHLGVRAAEEKESPALKWADDAEEKNLSDKEKTAEKIKTLYLKGEYEGILLLIQENPSVIETLQFSETGFYIGAAFYFLGGYENALEFLEKALEKNLLPDSLSPVCLYITALSYEASGDHKKTAQTLELFLAKHAAAASEPEVYLLLARTYFNLKEIKRKNEILLKIEEKFSNQSLDPSIQEEIKNLKEAK